MAGFLNPAMSALGVTPTGADPNQGLPPLPPSQNTLEIPQVYQPQAQQTQEIPSQYADAGSRPPPAPGGNIPFTPRRELLQAMGQQESGGVRDPAQARGKAGEVGRMQVRPQTALMYGVTPEQLRANPSLADSVGERYYTDLLRRYHGNEFLALVAYNSGPGRVDRGQLLPQSVKYATAILKRAPTGGAQAAAQQGPQLTPPGPQSTPSMTAMLQQAAPPSPGQPPQQPAGDQQGPLQQAIRQQADLYPYQQMLDPTGAVDPTAAAMMAAQGGGAPQQAQAAPTQPLQQMLAGQGPETQYGPLGAAPLEADIAGEGYSPREVRGMEPFAMGAVGGVEGEVPELSGAARAMVRRARQFGVDPADIGPLAQRVREGTLTNRGLSQALQALRGKLPQTAKTAAMIRGAAEDIPRDVLGAISRAVREGDLTAQQAKKMLKAITGGAALLPLIGAERQEPTAAPTAAQPGQLTPPGPQAQPGILQRMGQSLGGALEGTAYAGEGDDFNARYFGGGAPSAAPAAAPAAAPPMGVTSVSPMTGGVTLGQPAVQVPNIDPAAASTTMRLSPTGGVSVSKTTRTTPPPAAERQQVAGAMTALVQTMDAIKYFDQNIQPHIDRYTGTATTAGGWRGYGQDIGYEHSRLASLLGIQADPEMKQFMAKLGPIQAGSLKGLSGGRVGIGIANFLGPHLPNPSKDDIPTLREKLEGLRQNLPIVIRTYNEMHGLGRSEEDIGARIEQLPWQGGPGATQGPTPQPSQRPTPAASPTAGAATLPPEAKNWKTSQAVQYLMENYRMSQDDAVAWIRAHPEYH